MEAAIRIEGLSKRFGDQPVLRGLNLTVVRGRTTVIIGRSGGGKSVLLRHLLGLMRPDSGHVWFGETDATALDDVGLGEHLKRIGMLFQNAALFDSMTVFENVAFPLREHRGLSPRECLPLVEETLNLVGLQGVLSRYPAELSGGMRKRVGLARAIILKPDILFYDEPTTGLDPIMTAVVDELIQKTQRHHNHTAVVISHDMRAVQRIAHTVAMLYDGRIIFQGTPEDLAECADPVVRQFVEGRTEGPIKVVE